MGRAELQSEAARARRVAEAYRGTALFESYERKAQIAAWKLEQFEQRGNQNEDTQRIP
jgi:hypothetical protein